ncbi:DUF3967 domain-containing protein [Paenibacillus alkalitolerans]|uniref:DUF3967 domain-containing protein n=1 Tax=Paenibacillus alkalitolerans TaxID=2799335 RepID=UPI0018F78C13|nr:DUF3967 domain-containing protein [Paenibacillus alkalitolerans]
MKTQKEMKEVAETLGLDEKTIHRWCLLLLWKGYSIQKIGKSSWKLKENDVMLLKQIKERMLKGQSLDEAAMMALNSKRDNINQDEEDIRKLIQQEIVSYLGERLGKTEEDVRQLKTVVNHMDVEINELRLKQDKILKDVSQQLNRQEEHQSFIEAQVKMRDEELVTILREIMETKKMVAATKENTWHRKLWKMIMS